MRKPFLNLFTFSIPERHLDLALPPIGHFVFDLFLVSIIYDIKPPFVYKYFYTLCISKSGLNWTQTYQLQLNPITPKDGQAGETCRLQTDTVFTVTIK
jgi:hypothetical protein